MSRRHFEPRKNISPEIKKEVKEAEDALHKSFEILEQDITGHMKNRVASGRIDSKEREDVANLKKDLKDAENYIDKEIKSINQARHLNEKE